MQESTAPVLEYAPTPSQKRPKLILFVSLLVFANFVWAAQAVMVKYVAPFLDPFATALLPFLIVTPLTIPILFIRGAGPKVRPNAKDWWQFTVAGVAGQITCQLGMTYGYTYGLVSNCTILYLLIPAMTAVLASIMLREKLTPLRILALIIGLAGAAMMPAQDLQNASFFASKYFKASAAMLVGCLAASFYNVYCKGLMQKFSDRDVLIYSYITATPAAALVLLFRNRDLFHSLAQFDTYAWIGMILNALLVYGLSMFVFFYVLQFVPVTVALASTYLTPVFGVLLGLVMMHEKLPPMSMIGAGIVLVSTVIIMKYDTSASGS